MHNASFPSEQMMTENKFNEWRAHKRLIVVHEIYSGHSRVTYDKLKPVVTDDNTTVDRKFMASYTIRNLAEIIAASNSLRAMYLDDDDRRWLVPRVTEQIKPHAYWVGFHAWLNSDGLAIIGWWAEEFLRTVNPVARGEHAPLTSAKQEVIEESMSEGYRIALDLGRMAIKYGEPSENQREQSVVLAVEEVRAHVASRRNMSMDDGRLEKPLLLRKALRAAGLMEPERSKNGTTPRVQYRARKEQKSRLGQLQDRGRNRVAGPQAVAQEAGRGRTALRGIMQHIYRVKSQITPPFSTWAEKKSEENLERNNWGNDQKEGVNLTLDPDFLAPVFLPVC